MAAGRMLPFRQFQLLIPSTCWNVPLRDYAKERIILKKMGYPEKPKKPPSGYLMYAAYNRTSVMSQHPDLSFTEISHLLNKKWKEMPESEKQKYTEEYQKRMAEYKAQMEDYNKLITDKQKEEMKVIMKAYNVSQKEKSIINEVKKLEKQLKKPKSPVSSFVVFCVRNYDIYQSHTPMVRIQKLSADWKKLSESEKQKYKVIFNQEYEQYKKNLEKWEEEMMQQGNVDLIRLKTLREKLQKSIKT